MMIRNKWFNLLFVSFFITMFFVPMLFAGHTSTADTRDKMRGWPWVKEQDIRRYVKNSQITIYNKTFNSAAIDTGTITDSFIYNTKFYGAPMLGMAQLDSLGRILVYVQNKTGSALAEGDVVVWDNTAISLADTTDILASTTRIQVDLSSEGGYYTVVVRAMGTPDAGDSVRVFGTTYEGGAGDTAICVLTASADAYNMPLKRATTALHFSDVDSILFNTDAVTDGADSCHVYAYGISTVLACDGANTDVAGVAIGAIADNAFGYICAWGVCKATVDAATNAASPGVLLEGAASGDAVVDAAATTGKNIGRALEYSNKDNFKILIFVDTF